MDEPLISCEHTSRAFLLVFSFTVIGALFCSGRESKAARPNNAVNPVDDTHYVGSETCRTCHAESYLNWKNTAMGRAFLEHAQTPLEKRACEACHGPGRTHVERGGDVASIIRFGKKSSHSVQEQNAQCLQCHDKGQRPFWEGRTHQSRGVACVTCHQIMQINAPSRFDEPLPENSPADRQTKK